MAEFVIVLGEKELQVLGSHSLEGIIGEEYIIKKGMKQYPDEIELQFEKKINHEYWTLNNYTCLVLVESIIHLISEGVRVKVKEILTRG